MSKLFENEKDKASEEVIFQSDDDEAKKIYIQTWKTKKQSMLPEGNSATYF